MAFLPAPQPARPQNVAMKVKVTDLSVFPQVSDRDLRQQQQDLFSQLPGKLNAAVLDKHSWQFSRAKTDRELQGFVRNNGNIIAPPPIPFQPYAPKLYTTRESWQKSPELLDADLHKKDRIAEELARAKDYGANFTPQPHDKPGKAMIPLPISEHRTPVEILGFQGMGRYSYEPHAGKAGGAAKPNGAALPPWLQEGSERPVLKAKAHNPSFYSSGIADALGAAHLTPHYGGAASGGFGQAVTPSPSFAESPSRSLADKGIAYPKDMHHHKKLFHIPDSCGGPSPPGARMYTREQTTTGEHYSLSRADALSQGRAQTSMLP